MRYCAKCRVTVRGGAELCPLCQSRLTGEPEAEPFPAVPTIYRQYEKFFKCLIFGTTAAAIICVAVNLMLPGSGAWSLFAVLGLCCFWIVMYLAIKRRGGIARYIANLSVYAALICILWDFVTGWRGWSLDFALPCAFTVGMLAIIVTSLVMKSAAADYIFSLSIIGFGGLVPLILYFTGALHSPIPSLICSACALIIFVGLIVFEGGPMKLELTKRFHL